MPSLAARTREAVRERPFLYDGLRAGVINYTAAARSLDVDGETEAVATALRRYADELDPANRQDVSGRVTMESGIGEVDDAGEDEPLLSIGGTVYGHDGGSKTAIVATGSLTVTAFERVLGVLRAAAIDVEAAGFASDALSLVVGRRDGPDALRAVEAALDSDGP